MSTQVIAELLHHGPDGRQRRTGTLESKCCAIESSILGKVLTCRQTCTSALPPAWALIIFHRRGPRQNVGTLARIQGWPPAMSARPAELRARTRKLSVAVLDELKPPGVIHQGQLRDLPLLHYVVGVRLCEAAALEQAEDLRLRASGPRARSCPPAEGRATKHTSTNTKSLGSNIRRL